MKFLALAQYTIKETISQKVILLLLGVLTMLIVVFIFGVHIVEENGVVREVSFYGGKPFTSTDLSLFLPALTETFVTFVFMATVVLCIVATAHVIAESLSDGTMTLFLSRPLSRISVLLCRYSGVSVAVGMIQLYFVLGFWLVLVGKTGMAHIALLLTFPPLFVSFASIFAFMCLLGMFSKSTGLATILALVHVFFISNVLAWPERFLLAVGDNGVLRSVVGIAYYTLPQIADLRTNALNALRTGSFVLPPLAFSMLSAVLALGMAAIRFRRMDL